MRGRGGYAAFRDAPFGVGGDAAGGGLYITRSRFGVRLAALGERVRADVCAWVGATGG